MTPGPLHSFAVGTEGSPDLAAARRVAGAIGTVHHEYVFGVDQVERALPDVIRHLESFDPTLVRSAVASYFVSRLASGLVKVVLAGFRCPGKRPFTRRSSRAISRERTPWVPSDAQSAWSRGRSPGPFPSDPNTLPN